MTTISKVLVGAVAAGAMAMVPTAAASADDRYNRDRGISVGDIIAGAVVLGGIAAVAGSVGRGGYDNRYDDRYGNRYDDRYGNRYDDRYRNRSDDRYNRGGYNGNPRAAVEQCVSAANNDVRRRGYRNAQVTEVRDVDNTNYGWKVKGSLQVDGNRGYYDRGYGRNNNNGYNNGYNNNGYYSNDRYSNDRGGYDHDSGSFTCWIDRGRVSRIDYNGIRGL